MATVGAYEVGGSFDTDPAAIIFGATLGNPVNDPWPTLAQLAKVDDDKDGEPGVTTPAEKGNRVCRSSGVLPVVERANILHVASRTV